MLESAEKLNNQAILHSSKGEFPEAIACFKRALTMEGENYLLWFNMGLTYKDFGDYTQARIAVEQAFRLNPNDEEVLETLALLCFYAGDVSESIYYCSVGLSLNPDNPHLCNTVGVVLFNQEDYEYACQAFEQAVTINPYYYDAVYNLRDTYEELGNKAGVLECENMLRQLGRKPN